MEGRRTRWCWCFDF